jgi:hypothetical protein
MTKKFTDLIKVRQRASQIARNDNICAWIYLYDKTYRLSTLVPLIYLKHRPTAKCMGFSQATSYTK